MDDLYKTIETKADITQLDKLIRDSRVLESSDTPRISPEIKKQEKLSDAYMDSLNNIKRETMQKLHEQYLELENSINNLKQDFKQLEDSMNNTLNRKVEKRDVDKMLSVYINKPDDYLAEITELKGEVGLMLKGLREEMLHNNQKFEQNIERRLREAEGRESNEEIKSLKEGLRESLENHKAEFEGGLKYLQTLTSSWKKELLDELQQVKKQQNETKLDIENIQLNKPDPVESLTIKQEISESRKTIADFNKRFDRVMVDHNKEIESIREETWEWIKRLEAELVNRFNETRAMMAQKADIEAVTHIIKSPRDDASYETLKLVLKEKADLADLHNLNKTLRDSLDNLGKELLLKANIKDVCTLLDSRQDTARLLEMMHDITNVLDNKASLEELKHYMIEQNIINEALCAENCVARWLWKSCKLKAGGFIPWEVQSVNTCPDNFLWEKDEAHVLAAAPGLYEIMLGFFTNTKPSVNLYVNGEPVICIDNNQRSNKNFRRHSAGNVVGLTLIDFIALPAQASLSLSFTGESEAEGFLGLRKL